MQDQQNKVRFETDRQSENRTVEAPRAGPTHHLCARGSASRGMTNANIDPLSCSSLRLPRKVSKHIERQRETDGASNLATEVAGVRQYGHTVAVP